jgi:LPXTG-motif cell wall-anchored protein
VNKECTIIVPTETKIVVTKIETPSVTPPELPHTGVSQDIISFLGLGTLVTTTAYYIASRRALNL